MIMNMVADLVLPLSEVILLLGIALTIGYGSSMVLHKLGIPNVLVYIVVGFLLGNFLVSDILNTESYQYWFRFIENIALGLIGFKIGTEMEIHLLKEHSRLITILTLSQVIITFILVTGAALLFTGHLIISLIFGGLATATAPAATMEIIRKFRAEGPLTKRLQWVLAFDDVLAVLIVEAILAYATIALIGESITLVSYGIAMAQEIILAIVIGLVVGFALDIFIERLDNKLEMMEISLGALILVMGLALYLHTSVILAAMAVGALTVNREGDNYKEAGILLEIIMSPILIIFFVLVGAELQFSAFNPFPWFAITYFVVRAIGKIYGTNFGAYIAKAEPNVKNNLGLGMLPQGGVALGLMHIAAELFIEADFPEYAAFLLTTIVISTVFSEGIGSFTAMFALDRAGELNKKLDIAEAQSVQGAEEMTGKDSKTVTSD